jgi:hypothetical protein
MLTLGLQNEFREVISVEWPIPVAARSEARFRGSSRAGIAGSNPSWSMDVFLSRCQVEGSAAS